MHLEIITKVKNAKSKEDLDLLRSEIFGKKGLVASLMQELSAMSIEEKKEKGSAINALKDELKDALNDRAEFIENEQWNKKLESEWVDTSIPCDDLGQGRFHPIMQTMADLIEIFSNMGFSVRTGPEMESTFLNFTALRVPEHHPARSEQDTFYISDDTLLRTQTSPVQIRTLQNEKPPIRIISPGRVYRPDYLDQTHSPMFHQMEILAIDTGIHMGHLRWVLEEFLRVFFGKKIEIRFRSSFFPFTEPSAEVDVMFNGKWLEVLGCGMVHPEIISSFGIDPAKYTGFAAGFGIERLAMLCYEINDLRPFFINDQRWLANYGFLANRGGL